MKSLIFLFAIALMLTAVHAVSECQCAEDDHACQTECGKPKTFGQQMAMWDPVF